MEVTGPDQTIKSISGEAGLPVWGSGNANSGSAADEVGLRHLDANTLHRRMRKRQTRDQQHLSSRAEQDIRSRNLIQPAEPSLWKHQDALLVCSVSYGFASFMDRSCYVTSTSELGLPSWK